MREDLVCGQFWLGGYHTSHLADKGANKEKKGIAFLMLMHFSKFKSNKWQKKYQQGATFFLPHGYHVSLTDPSISCGS